MNTGTPGTPGQNQPSVDSIQEMAIQTSNFAAEFGQVGGGVFNLTMKSGTNQFHGTAYDYYVNEFLNAGNPYTNNGRGGNTRQVQRRNDYGFTIGGPVWIPKIYDGKDKTFFFVNWEQFRENQAVNNQQQTVPIADYRNGDFAKAITARPVGMDPLGRAQFEGMVFDPLTQRAVGAAQVRDQFPNNRIPVARFDPVSAKIQGLFPAPQGINAGGLTNNYINVYTSSRVTTIPSIKVDQTVGSKGKLSFFWQRTETANPNGNPTLGQSDGLPGHLTTALGSFVTAPLYRLNYDHSLTPTLLMHFGGGYRATYFSVPAVTPEGLKVYADAPYDAAKQIGLNGLPLGKFLPRFSGMLSTTTGGMKDFGATATGIPGKITQSPTFNTNLTWVKSNHTFKFGAEYRTENYYAGGTGDGRRLRFLRRPDRPAIPKRCGEWRQRGIRLRQFPVRRRKFGDLERPNRSPYREKSDRPVCPGYLEDYPEAHVGLRPSIRLLHLPARTVRPRSHVLCHCNPPRFGAAGCISLRPLRPAPVQL
jgi:hypothetical protein